MSCNCRELLPCGHARANLAPVVTIMPEHQGADSDGELVGQKCPVCAELALREAAVLEACAQAVENHPNAQSVATGQVFEPTRSEIAATIRALKPDAAKLVEQVRLEEAEWWDAGGRSARECSERIAALQKHGQPTEEK